MSWTLNATDGSRSTQAVYDVLEVPITVLNAPNFTTDAKTQQVKREIFDHTSDETIIPSSRDHNHSVQLLSESADENASTSKKRSLDTQRLGKTSKKKMRKTGTNPKRNISTERSREYPLRQKDKETELKESLDRLSQKNIELNDKLSMLNHINDLKKEGTSYLKLQNDTLEMQVQWLMDMVKFKSLNK